MITALVNLGIYRTAWIWSHGREWLADDEVDCVAEQLFAQMMGWTEET